MSQPVSDLTPRQRRRMIAVGLIRGGIVAIALTVVYYVLPLHQIARLHLWFVLSAGVIVLSAVTVYQVAAILRARHPAVRAIEAVAITGPLFLYLFAAIYYTMSQVDASSFNVSDLSRTDTLYFTVTTFATVGFGDIVATTETARVLVTVQMILDLILLGAVIRVFATAVQQARQRAEPEQSDGS